MLSGAFITQLAKNLPAMQETYVQSQVWEDHLQKGIATCCSIHSCLGNPMDRGAWQATVHGVAI